MFEVQFVQQLVKFFGFDDVVVMVQDLVLCSYVYCDVELVGSFGNLNYDQYCGICFCCDRDLWLGSCDFVLDLLLFGVIFYELVDVSFVDNGVVLLVKFDLYMFEFDLV